MTRFPSLSRRQVLATAAAATTSGLLPRTFAAEPLRILILGGTGFIGPHMVRRALSRGHDVTLFNRGRTNTDLFPEVTTLVGDRDGKLDALTDGHWDVVIDNSGYVPRHVRDSAQLLAERASRYLFISTISTYADYSVENISEDFRLAKLPDDHTGEDVTGETYGPFKVLCEKAVQEAFSERATVVRPGYIVGPGDRTDRWTYWPVRMTAGGTMLVPGGEADPVQYIDARDLADFVIQLVEDETPGIYNAVGPDPGHTMSDMMAAINAVIEKPPELVRVTAEFMADQSASVPIWAPYAGPTRGIHTVSQTRALAAGLQHRDPQTTVRDTLDWWATLSDERRSGMRAGLRVTGRLEGQQATLKKQMAEEKRLLRAWGKLG